MRNVLKEKGLGEYERDEEQKNNEEQKQEEELSRVIVNEAESYNEDAMDEGEEDGEHKRKEEKRQQEKEKLFRSKKVLVIVFRIAAKCRNEFIERVNVNVEISNKETELKKEEDGEKKRREEKGQQKEEQLFSGFDGMHFIFWVTGHQEDRYIEEGVEKEDSRQKKTWEEKEELLRLIELHSSCRLKKDPKKSHSRWSIKIAQLLSSFQQLEYSTSAVTAEHRVQYREESSTPAPPVSVNDAKQQTSDPDFPEYREDDKLTLTSPVSTHSTEQETSDPAGSAEDKDQKILEGPTASISVNGAKQEMIDPDSAEQWEEEKLTLTSATSIPSTEVKTSNADSNEDKKQEPLNGPTAARPASVNEASQQTLIPDSAKHWDDKKLTLTSATSTPSTELETSHAGSGEDKEQKRWKGPTTPSLESAANAIPGPCKPDPAENNQQKKWACDLFCTKHYSRTARKVTTTSNLLVLLFLYCFMTLSSASNHGKQTHCAVNLDGALHQWRLICYFKINLRESSQDFQIFYIKEEGPFVLVVDASWDDGEPKLYTAKGFHSEGVVNDTAAIRIQGQAVQHGGTFFCLLPRVSLEDVLSCRIPKHKEHHATALVTTQPPVPVVSGGWKHVPHREMLLLTVAAIVSKRLYSPG